MFRDYANIVVDEEYVEKLMRHNIFRIKNEARKLLLPPPAQSVSEWAEEKRYLPDQKWRNSKTPYLKAIMDAASNPEVREMSIMKSAQIGGTQAVLNIIGWVIDYHPTNIIYMLPTDADILDFVSDKFDPMIKSSPSLRKKIRNIKSDNPNEKEKTRKKKFPGGWIKFITGSSTSGTRQRTARVTVDDDTDQLIIGQQREGDPVERLKARSKVHKWDKLNIHVSTPTRTGQSRIDALYNLSNMQKYYVPCPHCNQLFSFNHERLVWQKDYEENLFNQELPKAKRKVLKHYPATAVYSCDNCAAEITEEQRLKIIDEGQWIAERPEVKDHYGYWFNEFISKMSSMQEIAKALIGAEDQPEKLESVYNTTLGLAFNPGVGEKIDKDELLARVGTPESNYIDPARPFVVPNEIYYAVQTVDVQKDRIETLVLGIGYQMECWVLLHQKFYGDPLQRKVYKDAEKVYFAEWRRQDGTRLPLKRLWVDCGYLQQSVFDFTRGKFGRGICAVKGKGGYGAPILSKTFSIVDKGRTKRIDIGSNATKDQIFQMLKNQEPGPNYIHFCDAYCNEDFFTQLTAERAVPKYTGLISYVVYEKENRGDRNEVLDLMYYAYAAAVHVNPNWKTLKPMHDARLAKGKPVTEKIFTPLPENEKEDTTAQKEPIKKAVRKGGRRVHQRRR